MTKRGMAKPVLLIFRTVREGSRFMRQDNIGENDYKFFQSLDIGDIIGVTGEVFKTRTGEITINISSFRLLSKALRPSGKVAWFKRYGTALPPKIFRSHCKS